MLCCTMQGGILDCARAGASNRFGRGKSRGLTGVKQWATGCSKITSKGTAREHKCANKGQAARIQYVKQVGYMEVSKWGTWVGASGQHGVREVHTQQPYLR